MMRHANRDMVLCITFASFLSPGSVSMTTKSMGDSDERPTCVGYEKVKLFIGLSLSLSLYIKQRTIYISKLPRRTTRAISKLHAHTATIRAFRMMMVMMIMMIT